MIPGPASPIYFNSTAGLKNIPFYWLQELSVDPSAPQKSKDKKLLIETNMIKNKEDYTFVAKSDYAFKGKVCFMGEGEVATP